MAVKNYYELLELPPTATADEIKRAFRAQIARYHPDKVQHLGKEFQAMAAERAAELTEAYRILSDETRRAEYDRASVATAGEAAAGAPAAASGVPRPDTGARQATTPPPPPEPEIPRGPLFSQERATSDEFVRRATVGRLRQAFEAVGGSYDESRVQGFDLAWVPKSKMFARGKGPRLLVKFASRVDKDTIAEAWTQAAKWAGGEEVCVVLSGPAMAPASAPVVAPAGELASAIAEQRRRSRGAKVTLIPVDGRTWHAYLPTDAPEIAKTLLQRVKSGA